jgi:hypothetical protein
VIFAVVPAIMVIRLGRWPVAPTDRGPWFPLLSVYVVFRRRDDEVIVVENAWPSEPQFP